MITRQGLFHCHHLLAQGGICHKQGDEAAWPGCGEHFFFFFFCKVAALEALVSLPVSLRARAPSPMLCPASSLGLLFQVFRLSLT